MHATTSDLTNRTLPMRGLQYIVSPSLPTSVQKHLGSAAVLASTDGGSQASTRQHREAPALPKLSGTYTSSDTRGGAESAARSTLCDPTFSDTLSRLGPSARQLLLQQAAEATGTHPSAANTSSFTRTMPTRRAVKCTGHTWGHHDRDHRHSHHHRPTQRSKHLPDTGADAVRANNGTSKRPSCSGAEYHYMSGSNGTRGDVEAQFSGTAPTLTHHGLNGTAGSDGTFLQRSGDGLYRGITDHPTLGSTLTRDPSQVPPLVHTLRGYLEREVRLCSDGSPIPSAVDQLMPYREAFRAMIAAFPGYSSLLSDIQSAYDNVIQCQAELLTEAYTSDTLRQEATAQHCADMAVLRQHIGTLQRDLQSMHAELEKREAAKKEVTEQQEEVRHSTGSTRADTFELRRQLERAQERLAEMEGQSKGDVKKILILIGAVRECDKRIKEFEDMVRRMSGQVDELDEFKRLAGEAQAELQRYKQRFQSVVPATDFALMKDYLTEELAGAQNVVRRLRRTAAVRGTQVDVMTRKINYFESLRTEDSGDGNDDSPKTPSTPRPKWAEHFTTLPELAEYSKPVHCAPLTSIANNSSTTNGVASPTHDDANSNTEILRVGGPTESSLLVEYLVSRVQALVQQTDKLERENKAAQETLNQLQATTVQWTHSAAETSSISPGAAGSASRQLAQSSGRGGYSYNRTRQPGATAAAGGDSSGPQTAAPGVVTRRAASPLLGPGVGEEVPVYLRACGVVPRFTLSRATCTQLLYDFFSDVLAPAYDSPDAEVTTMPEMWMRFLEDAMVERHDVSSHFRCVSHVAINLLEDARDPALTNPALTLLANILGGTMPPRLAVDAAIVVSHCMEDVEALAKEQQKTRLRRQAISECLNPILELKTPRDMEELRSTLTNDPTFDVSVFLSVENRFMGVFFLQECRANMELYEQILVGVTAKSEAVEGVVEGDCVVWMAEVAEAIKAVEPLTPVVVLRELSENALAATRVETNGSHAPGTDQAEQQQQQAQVRLSEVIGAINVAPLIRRSVVSVREACAL